MEAELLKYIDMIFETLKPLLEVYSGEKGFLAQFLSIVGTLRIFIPPIQNILGVVVILTPTDKDNKLFNKVVNSKAYKAFLYVLELLSSLRLKKK